MAKKILIIGAGIGGLSAGCYGQMNGYDTEIYEMHDIPGGLCTSWSRKGYTIDGSIYYLLGSNASNPIYDYWTEVGAFQDKELIQHDEFYRVEGEDGRTCILYSDLHRLEEHLLSLSPLDKDLIQEMIRVALLFTTIPNPTEKPYDLYSWLDWLKMFYKLHPYFKDFQKYAQITLGDFADQFRDPLIRETLKCFPPTYQGMSLFFCTLASYHNQDAGYPLGGSREFSKSIAKHYTDLGGKLHYKAKVDRVLVKNNQAVGIRLSDGTEVCGDYILPAINSYSTMFDLLGGRYVNQKLKGYYETLPTLTNVQVALGVDYDLSQEPHFLGVKLPEPVTLGGMTIQYVFLKHYGYDTSLSPSGKSLVLSFFEASYDYWKNLADNPEAYAAEKKKFSDLVIQALNQKYPVCKGNIEMVDVATPLTYVRYTDTWKGAYMSWIEMTKTGFLRVSRTLPGLENLYMLSQWTNPPGGLPSALVSGRWAIQILCKKDKKAFTTTKTK
ncbi:phytoene desaturase family protein [Desulfitobacterium metallireducens]|uniref:Amine oxidase n=1 Tax=Desulfitobacterium metallireducens DSM 15288 TaxID=871968 RepID=W0E6I9_9FIRM|nr:NAD(P)/FAD-dependent oxidoreductase [Desulfitobacterium metallireducens]AHF06372.1 amine oxidase [Desulfitobacterium metallireducens DSM 15288]